MTTAQEARAAEVDRRLSAAEHAAAERHAGLSETVRHSFARLRGGLERAHTRSDTVDEREWADYVTQLDRGLDEMHIELGRAAEHPDAGPEAAKVLTTHASKLELDGWRLQFTVLDADARARLAASEAELASYRAGDRPAADDLERSLDQLRAAAAPR
ncbi:hypothetical protein Afe04nite_16650 [Asanoa ferruginea]|uniref:hypothetical protein n=1 Tax=Asanoa ferruginea TaxID=53367 RepID=UPI0011C19549|nr:hypothetical protein [Asanoa ferruginea]GIF47126.1 hypothetical protein Afe04nite_16650 [Asanoa ferruginea]